MKSQQSAGALWDPQRRSFTAGLVVIITIVAFEAMGLATALPTIVAEFGARGWYSWPFTVFLASSVVATVLAGRIADSRGPARQMLVALPSFALGLVIAGVAPNMVTLLAARVLQGFSAGTVIVSLYVMIARVYPEQHRPAAFGVLSAAWVMPALLGPAVAGFLTEHASWRWVFLGLAPPACIGAVLLIPTMRRFGGRPDEPPPPQRRGLPLAAPGAAAGVLALNWSAQNLSSWSVLSGIAALVVLTPSLRILLPQGTFSARQGIPVMVLARGLLAGIFFGAQAFVPLILSVDYHLSPAEAGVPLTLGSIGWFVGSMWQSRKSPLRRESVVAVGFVLVATGITGLLAIASGWVPAAVPVTVASAGTWFVAGTGMGASIASTAVRVLSLSPRDERGFNSAALQIADMLGQTALIGVGGVLVSLLARQGSPTAGVAPLDFGLVMLGLVAAAVIYRTGRRAV